MKFIKIDVHKKAIYPVEIRKGHELEDWYKEIGCELVEFAHSPYLPDNISLIFDEEYLLKEERKINVPASVLFGALDHNHPIMGNVLIGLDVQTDDGTVTVGFDDGVHNVMNMLVTVIQEKLEAYNMGKFR